MNKTKKVLLLIILFISIVFIFDIKSYAGEFTFDKDKYTIYSSVTIDAKFQDGDDDRIEQVIPEPDDGLMDFYIYDNQITINNRNNKGGSKIYAVKVISKQGYEKNFIVKLLNESKMYNLIFGGGFVGQTRDISEVMEADDVESIVSGNENVIKINGTIMEYINTGKSSITINYYGGNSSGGDVGVIDYISFTPPENIPKIPIISGATYLELNIDAQINNEQTINLYNDEVTVDGTDVMASIFLSYNKPILYLHFNYDSLTPGIKECHFMIPNIVDETFNVEFYNPIKSMSLNKKSLTMEVGETFKLEKIFNPYDASFNEINNFYSSDEDVATVDKNGNVTAIKTGLAVITAEVDGYDFNRTYPAKTVFTYDCTVLVLGKQLQVTTLNVISLLKFNTKTPISNVVTKDNFPILNENYNVKVLSKTGVEKTNEDNIGSRDQIVVTSPENEEVTTFTAVVKGDVSGNGLTKVYDAYQVLNQSIANKELDEINSYAMDYNDDGDVKIYDAYKFLNVAISQ